MTFKPGRGLLGPLKPLLGDWRFEGEHNGQALVGTRRFEPFGKGWVRLEAAWKMIIFDEDGAVLEIIEIGTRGGIYR